MKISFLSFFINFVAFFGVISDNMKVMSMSVDHVHIRLYTCVPCLKKGSALVCPFHSNQSPICALVNLLCWLSVLSDSLSTSARILNFGIFTFVT